MGPCTLYFKCLKTKHKLRHSLAVSFPNSSCPKLELGLCLAVNSNGFHLGCCGSPLQGCGIKGVGLGPVARAGGQTLIGSGGA